MIFLPTANPIRSVQTVENFRSKLIKYHDEIADLKSYFDGRGSDAFDESKLPCVF